MPRFPWKFSGSGYKALTPRRPWLMRWPGFSGNIVQFFLTGLRKVAAMSPLTILAQSPRLQTMFSIIASRRGIQAVTCLTGMPLPTRNFSAEIWLSPAKRLIALPLAFMSVGEVIVFGVSLRSPPRWH